MAVKFGKYILLDKIATGGMAEIWLAKQTGVEGFEKLVVIKKILPHFTHDKEFVTMFLDEARIAAKLNHPNIVQIYDLGKEQNTYYIAMEYISGDDIRGILQTSIKQGKFLPLQLAVRIISQAAAGLHYAHTLTDMYGTPMNIVHRDISPQNILVTYTGTTKIVDFGIAKAATQSQETRAGTLKGKFAYMSPEQALGKKLDGRSDLFALGIVLYEITVGKRLFKSDSELKTLRMITEEPIVSPIELNPKYPKRLNDIIMKALERDRDKRFKNCNEFHVELEAFLRDYPKPSSTVDLSKWMKKIFAEKIEKVKARHEQLLKESPDDLLLTDILENDKSKSKSLTDTSNISQISQMLGSSSLSLATSTTSGTNSGYMNNPLITSNSAISYTPSNTSGNAYSTYGDDGGSKKLLILLLTALLVILIGIGVFLFFTLNKGCPKGYTGENCDVCAKGYYKFGDECVLVKCPKGYRGKDCSLCDENYQDNDKDGTCKPTCKIANLVCDEGEYCSTKTGVAKCVPKLAKGMNFDNESENTINNKGKTLKIPVNSVPSLATIIINGKKYPQPTDTIVGFEIGKKYDVILRKEGFKSSIKNFVFNENITKLEFKLEPDNVILGNAKLILTKYPKEAIVVFDGITYNNPDSEVLVLKKLPEGKHILQVKLDGYKPENREIVLSERGPLQLTIKLKRSSAKYQDITVKTIPEGAYVYINGKKTGKTPLTDYSVRARNKYYIKLVKRGYKTEKLVRYKNNISLPINITLKELAAAKSVKENTKNETAKNSNTVSENKKSEDTGMLTINTVPFTDIYLNGKHIGSTPLAKYKLPVGRHKLILKNKNAMISYSINVRIKKDEELKQVIKFKKGTLKVISNGNPQIYINGRKVGEGNLSKELYEGTYYITIRDIGKIKKYTITIKARRTEVINF